jgi:hypothetical protein
VPPPPLKVSHSGWDSSDKSSTASTRSCTPSPLPEDAPWPSSGSVPFEEIFPSFQVLSVQEELGDAQSCPPEVPHTGISELNEDILHLIFEHFDLRPSSSTIFQTRKDLLSAAKTCKAFVEPALNSLWRVLPSLLPLLLLLPSAEVRDNHYVSPRPSLPISQFGLFH